MDEGTRLRIKSALSSWLTVLLVLSLVVGTVGAWSTYTAHVESETTTVQRTTTVWSATGSFDHSATVTNSNPLFPVGTTLTNRSTYFRAAAPVLDGAFTVGTSGLDGNASVELAAALVVQSADEETTYWRDSRPLNATSDTAADGPATVAFSLNTSAVADRIAEIQQGIGSTPGETSVAVVVDVQLAGTTADGAASSLRFTSRLPVALNGDTYAVSDPGTVTEEVQQTTTEQVPREYGPLRSIGGPIALFVGLVAIAGLGFVAGRDRPAITDAERARLEFLEDRSEFDQWIVSVRLPADADRPTAEAASLADLVNLAIDSNAPVVEDPNDDAFSVVTDEYRYTYRPPPPVDHQPVVADLRSLGAGASYLGALDGGTDDGTDEPATNAETDEPATDAKADDEVGEPSVRGPTAAASTGARTGEPSADESGGTPASAATDRGSLTDGEEPMADAPADTDATDTDTAGRPPDAEPDGDAE